MEAWALLMVEENETTETETMWPSGLQVPA